MISKSSNASMRLPDKTNKHTQSLSPVFHFMRWQHKKRDSYDPLNNNNNDVKQTVCERDYLHIIIEAEDIFENVTLKTARYQYQ